MKAKPQPAPVERIESFIQSIRGQKIIMDSDLAALYGVQTRVLNQAVKRNKKRFPEDFMFQLKVEEANSVSRSRSQIVILNETKRSRPQNPRIKRGQNIKYLPYAFTENGAVMAANVLNSPQAVRMSIFIVRAFIKMREMLASSQDLAKELRDLERKLTSRLDNHETAIVDVLRRIMRLLDPPPSPPEPERPKRQIGFRPEPK